jgi:CubicO group peptidase (beta-lactamase class C family)
VSDEFPRTSAVLEQEVRDGLFTRGAQVTVRYQGEVVLDVALGDAGVGKDVTPETVFRVYCTIKPITAVAVVGLLDRGELELEEPVVERLPNLKGLPSEVRIVDLLDHTAGLHRIAAVRMEMLPPAKQREVLERASPPSGWRVGRDAGYSEYAAWNLLGWIIQDVSGEDLRTHLRRRVLDPLGMADTWVGMTDEEYDAVLPRLGVNYDLTDYLQGFPMVIERTPRWCCEVNPAHGGYTTARDLATFYDALLVRLDGEGNDALPSPDALATATSAVRPRVFDEVLDRECEYGLGFMTDLAHHAFGPMCSPSSFGHSGNVGSSFAFADPEHDLAAAVVFNGIGDSESSFLRRPAIVGSLYHDLGLLAGDDEDGDVVYDDADGEGGTEEEGAPRRGLRRFLRR